MQAYCICVRVRVPVSTGPGHAGQPASLEREIIAPPGAVVNVSIPEGDRNARAPLGWRCFGVSGCGRGGSLDWVPACAGTAGLGGILGRLCAVLTYILSCTTMLLV